MAALKSIVFSFVLILIIKIIVTSYNVKSEEVSSVPYDKVIAFTFDDGPSVYTKEIAKVLLEYNFKATFFELGNRMKYNQDTVNFLVDNDMEIGNHTYSHKKLVSLTKKEIDEELNSTLIVFNEITGNNITLTRVPYGEINEKVQTNITTPIISWSVDTKDWLYQDENYIYNYILSNIKDGDIILMHDIYFSTLQAIKKTIPILAKNGYKITTVSELAKLKGCTLEARHLYKKF